MGKNLLDSDRPRSGQEERNLNISLVVIQITLKCAKRHLNVA